MTYPLAKPGIFQTIQGEGHMLGVPMVFIRLAGCSVGCPQCDTNYQVHERVELRKIMQRVDAIQGNARWVWITGGEPADHDLLPLCDAARHHGNIALITSGTKGLGPANRLIDFLCVSPHGLPDRQKINGGSQINLVPGLNGLSLSDWDDYDATGFVHRYVTPLAGAESLDDCLAFIARHPSWRLGVQTHKVWGLP